MAALRRRCHSPAFQLSRLKAGHLAELLAEKLSHKSRQGAVAFLFDISLAPDFFFMGFRCFIPSGKSSCKTLVFSIIVHQSGGGHMAVQHSLVRNG